MTKQERGIIVGIEEQFVLAGIFLLILEVAIPGFGVCAAGSILCFTVAAYFFMGGGMSALLVLAVAYAIVIAAMVWLCHTLPSDSKWNPLVLLERQNAMKNIDANEAHQSLVGKQGKALTPLRPSGTAIIEGRRQDVLTEGDYISNNALIKVIRVEGRKIFVEQVTAEDK